MGTEKGEIIPMDQLVVGTKVKTPDGQFRAIVETRNATCVALRFTLFNGCPPPKNPVLEYGYNTGLKLVLDEDSEEQK